MKNVRTYNGLKRAGATLVLVAITGALTGCANRDKNMDVAIVPQVTEVVATATPTPTSTPYVLVETEEPTIEPTVEPIVIPIPQGNLRTCSEYRVVNGNEVNMRLDANTNSMKLGKLNKGDMVVCIAEYKDWTLAIVGRTICYIKTEFLSPYASYESPYTYEENLDIVYATTGINFRLSPEVIDTNKILLIPEGAELEVFGQTNNGWYLVKYRGQIGYVSAKYTKSLRERIQAVFPEITELKFEWAGVIRRNTSLLRRPSESSSTIYY